MTKSTRNYESNVSQDDGTHLGLFYSFKVINLFISFSTKSCLFLKLFIELYNDNEIPVM